MKRRIAVWILFTILALCALPVVGNFQITPYTETAYEVVGVLRPQVNLDGSVVLASTVDDYVDATYSTTYGAQTLGPPSGAGNADAASSDWLEASFVENLYTTKDGPHSMSTFPPTGWSTTGWSQIATGGNPTYYASSGAGGIDTLTSGVIVLTGYTGVRWTWDSKDFTTLDDFWEDGDFYIQTYTGSWVTQWSNTGYWETWTQTQDSQVTSYSAWQVRFVFVGTTDEYCGVDNILIEAYVAVTYYRLEFIWRFDSVDYNTYPSEYLYFDFDATSSAETLDIYVGTSTNPTNLVGNSKATDFNVDIHSYLTGATFYVKVIDESRSGDTDADTWLIDACFIRLTNAVPSADSVDLTNPDVYGVLYAYKTLYTITANLSDGDGYGDIYKVLILFGGDGGDDPAKFSLQWLSGAWSEIYGESLVELVSGSCSSSGSGTTLNLTFAFWVTFSVYDYHQQNVYDLRLDVWDSDDSDYLIQDSNFAVVTDFGLQSVATTDSRVNKDTADAATISGTLAFNGKQIYPNDEKVDIWVKCTDVSTSPWEATGYSDITGAFSIAIDSDDVVGKDAYEIIVVMEDTGAGGTSLLSTQSIVDIIADSVTVTLSSTYTYVPPSAYTTITATGVYAYDGSSFDGTITTNATVGYLTKSVGSYGWHVTGISGGTYGITAYTSTDLTVVWDVPTIASGPSYYWVQYDFDSAYLVWGFPSTYQWNTTGGWLQVGTVLKSYRNDTVNAIGAIFSTTGDFNGLTVGPFDSSWYYVNLSIRVVDVIGGYSWNYEIWNEVLLVDILHSIHIEDSVIYLTDDYLTIGISTNWNNASIIVWDQKIDNETPIGFLSYEAWFQIPLSDVVGQHNLTILVNGSHSSTTWNGNVQDWSESDSWKWLQFIYGVPETVLTFDTNIVVVDTLGQTIDFATFEVYKNGTRLYYPLTVTYSSLAYNITVVDRWGETLNSTIFVSGDYEFVIVVNAYSFKVMSWYEDFCFFNLTHGGLTFTEVISPLETIEFSLFAGSYTYSVDYRNGTTVNGGLTLTGSTALVVTGSTIADVAGMSSTLLAMTTEINVTLYSTQNQVLTISIDLSNINTTINQQLIQVLLNITNTNTTIYQQTIDLLAAIQNTNSTLYDQLVQLVVDLSNVNSTLYTQTLSILSQISNMNSTIYSATLSVYNSILAVNSTLYGVLVDITNMILANSSVIYGDFIVSLENIWDAQTNLDYKVTATNQKIQDVEKTLNSFTQSSQVNTVMNLTGFACVIVGMVVIAALVKTKRITLFEEDDYEKEEGEKEKSEPKPERDVIGEGLHSAKESIRPASYDRVNESYRKRRGLE